MNMTKELIEEAKAIYGKLPSDHVVNRLVAALSARLPREDDDEREALEVLIQGEDERWDGSNATEDFSTRVARAVLAAGFTRHLPRVVNTAEERDALPAAEEMESLTAQLQAAIGIAQEANDDCRIWAQKLQAAEAVIAAAYGLLDELDLDSGRVTASGTAWGSILRDAKTILSRADTSAHDAAIRAAKAEAVREALHEWRIHGSGDMYLWLTQYGQRIESIEQTEAEFICACGEDHEAEQEGAE